MGGLEAFLDGDGWKYGWPLEAVSCSRCMQQFASMFGRYVNKSRKMKPVHTIPRPFCNFVPTTECLVSSLGARSMKLQMTQWCMFDTYKMPARTIIVLFQKRKGVYVQVSSVSVSMF